MNGVVIYLFCLFFICTKCEIHSGPDDWNENFDDSLITEGMDIPPDLKLTPIIKQPKDAPSKEQLFFKRIVTIVLKGGQLKNNEDSSVDVRLQMKFDQKQYKLLDEYISSESIMTDDKFRRVLAYIEEAVYQPSMIENKILVWSEFLQAFFVVYKMHITWGLAILSLFLGMIWFCKNVAYHHKLMTGFILFYTYEVFISYKEAEKKELDSFISAMNTCKWRFWSNKCDVPPPDPLIFLKHMNPLKIGIRMFTNIISEPMIALSATIKIMVEGIADGLWYPFDKIFYGVLIVFFNVLLLVILLMVLFNFLLNVPFSFNLWGLINLRVPRRARANSLVNDIQRQPNPPLTDNNDSISQPTLNRILDILSRTIPNQGNQQTYQPVLENKLQMPRRHNINSTALRRSASTGRLANASENSSTNIFDGVSKRSRHHNGSGDAQPRFAI